MIHYNENMVDVIRSEILKNEKTRRAKTEQNRKRLIEARKNRKISLEETARMMRAKLSIRQRIRELEESGEFWYHG